MLCDRSIIKHIRAGDIVIDPQPPHNAIQPASVDVMLGARFIEVLNVGDSQFFSADLPLSPPAPDLGFLTETFCIMPGQCVLASTRERIKVPDFMVARVEGKSTWGRRFLQVHSTAGFIDPGFFGRITLELKNQSPAPLILPVGGAIAQISFDLLDAACDRPYGSDGLFSHYQGQDDTRGPAW